jgi:NADH dehydrogenase
MNTKKIVIVGGGFGGLSALRQLCASKRRNNLEITLIDKREESHFLPMLPDVIGRDIRPQCLTYSFKDLERKFGFCFINDTVCAVDIGKHTVATTSQVLNYDYLLIASGSQTNFYAHEVLRGHAYTLDYIVDVERIKNDLEQRRFDIFAIIGGGYTGIEVATNLQQHFNKYRRYQRIIIVERTSSLLGPLPMWIKKYVYRNLRALNIEVMLNSEVERIEDRKIVLSGGVELGGAMLIWTAGVKTDDFTFNLPFEKGPQRRLKVDEYLRVDEHCFAVGDVANVIGKGKPLRMAVQFAIAQGRVAARNIMSTIEGKPLRNYRPVDLGYLIPMANNSSCGVVFGIPVIGWLATLLHYCMCVYRAPGMRNKAAILYDLLGGGRKGR